jgi:3-oxoadipate enol-lactonase
LHFIDQGGDEPAVLCIHGNCQSSAYWAPTVKRLGEVGRRGLAPDLPGFGASASLPGPYGMATYADCLAEFLTAHGLGRIVLVGGSMGGVVAQYFALRYPLRLTRLLLVATGGFTADPGAAMHRAQALAAAPWNEAAVRPIVTGFFYEPPAPSQLAEVLHIALMASHQAAVEAAQSNAESRPFDRLDEITVPTLIIQGRHDRARTPEHGALMCERIPGARLEVLENCGHTPQLEEPEAFHHIALPFLLAGR